MNIFKNIFKKIASLFGLQLQEKPVDDEDYIATGENLPITAIISNKISTLALMDSEIKVSGDSAKATFIDEMLRDYVFDRIAVACEVALGTGDCLIKPFTDGTDFGIDIIKNNDFIVAESIGNTLKSVIIKADEIKKGLDTYTRFETQMLKEVDGVSYLIIKQTAFKGEMQIPLIAVDTWAGIQEETIIKNCNQLLFGRIKSPTVNREDVNGVNGVKITYGNDKLIKNAIEAYERFNREYEDKEAFIFASKTLLQRDEEGNVKLPKGKKRMFMTFSGVGDNNSLIHEYSPEIRTDSLERGLEMNLKMLEMACGLSAGILTAPHTNYATATEMKASIQSTFAYITKFRKFIEGGVNGLISAIDLLITVNNVGVLGDFQIEFEWSTSFVEQLNEQFNRLMQAESIGAVDKAEVRQFVLDEDYQTAKERVEEISKGVVEDEEI